MWFLRRMSGASPPSLTNIKRQLHVWSLKGGMSRAKKISARMEEKWDTFGPTRKMEELEKEVRALKRSLPSTAWQNRAIGKAREEVCEGGDYWDTIATASAEAIASRAKTRKQIAYIVNITISRNKKMWSEHALLGKHVAGDDVQDRQKEAERAVHTAVRKQVNTWWNRKQSNPNGVESLKCLAARESALIQVKRVLTAIQRATTERVGDRIDRMPSHVDSQIWPKDLWEKKEEEAEPKEIEKPMQRRNPLRGCRRRGRPSLADRADSESETSSSSGSSDESDVGSTMSTQPRRVEAPLPVAPGGLRIGFWNATGLGPRQEESDHFKEAMQLMRDQNLDALAVAEMKLASLVYLNIQLATHGMEFLGGLNTKGRVAKGGVGFIIRKGVAATLIHKNVQNELEICTVRTQIGDISVIYARKPKNRRAEWRKLVHARITSETSDSTFVMGDLNLHHNSFERNIVAKSDKRKVKRKQYQMETDMMEEMLEDMQHTIVNDSKCKGTFYTSKRSLVIDYITMKQCDAVAGEAPAVHATDFKVVDVHETAKSGHRAIVATCHAPQQQGEGQDAPTKFRCPRIIDGKAVYSTTESTLAQAVAKFDFNTDTNQTAEVQLAQIMKQVVEAGEEYFGVVGPPTKKKKRMKQRPLFDATMKAAQERVRSSRRRLQKMTRRVTSRGANRRVWARLIHAKRQMMKARKTLTRETSKRKHIDTRNRVQLMIESYKENPAQSSKQLWDMYKMASDSSRSCTPQAVTLAAAYQHFAQMSKRQDRPAVIKVDDFGGVEPEITVEVKERGGHLTKDEEKTLERRYEESDFPKNVMTPITEDEVREQLKKTGSWKAPGFDGLRAGHYMEFYEESADFRQAICTLFTRVLQHQEWPKDWKSALLTLIYKGKGDPKKPVAYRPISLLPVLGKLCERVIFTRFRKDEEVNKGVSAEQGAFRTERGSAEGIALVLRAIEKEINKKRAAVATRKRLLGAKARTANNDGVYVAVTDVAKAYDTVAFERALYNSQYRGKPLKLLRAWLYERETRVTINSKISNAFNVERGTPQGAVGSPPTFADFVDSVTKVCALYGVEVVTNRPKIATPLFADDIALICGNWGDLKRAWKALLEWMDKNGLDFNVGKCSTMFIPTNKKAKHPSESLRIGRKAVKWAKEVTYLGIQIKAARFTKTNKGEANEESIPQKVVNAWVPIQLMLSEGQIPLKSAITLYESAVLSKLFYGSEFRIHNRIPKSWIKFHKDCCRYMCGSYKTDHGCTVRGELGLPSLQQMLDKRVTNLVIRNLTTSHEIIRETFSETMKDDGSDLGEAWRESFKNLELPGAVSELTATYRKQFPVPSPQTAWSITPRGDKRVFLTALRAQYKAVLLKETQERAPRTWTEEESKVQSVITKQWPDGTGKSQVNWCHRDVRLYDVVRTTEAHRAIFHIRTRSTQPNGMACKEQCMVCNKKGGDNMLHLITECKRTPKTFQDLKLTLPQNTVERTKILMLEQECVEAMLEDKERMPLLRSVIKGLAEVWSQRRKAVRRYLKSRKTSH